MIKINFKTLVILAHLDDEFAISPIIKRIARRNPKNIKIIYCAERLQDSIKLRQIRRDEIVRSADLSTS